MRPSHRIRSLLLCATAMSGGASAAAVDGVPVAWQHQRVTINYFGVTTLYTCDGLEEQIRRVLLYLGARKDLRVIGHCAYGSNVPVHDAIVDADFYVPAPVGDSAVGAAAMAQWTPLELTPRHPNFMSADDCELMQDMKDAVVKNFNLRGLDYRTSCFPNELSIDGFAVKGEALKVLAPKTG
jgi:hypothetical protein